MPTTLPEKAIQKYVEKLGSKEAYETQLKEFEDDAKEFNIPEPARNQWIKNRFDSFFLKSTAFGSQEAEIEFIPLTARKSDFGHEKRIKLAQELAKKDTQETIKQGFMNTEGQYLGKKGEVITLTDWTKESRMLFRKTPEEPWQYGLILAKENSVWREQKEIPLFHHIKAKVIYHPNAGKNNETGKVTPTYSLTDSTEKLEGKKLTFDEVKAMLKNHFKDWITTPTKLLEWAEKNSDKDFSRFAAFIANSAGRGLVYNETGRSDVIELSEPENETQEYPLTCWLDKQTKELPGRHKKIVDGALNLIVLGNPSVGTDQSTGQKRVSFNAQGIFVDDIWLIKDQPKLITPESTTVQQEPDQNEAGW